MTDLALSLPLNTARHVIDQRPGYVRFCYFVKPQPEAVMRQLARLGLDVRRWHVSENQTWIDVWYEGKDDDEQKNR